MENNVEYRDCVGFPGYRVGSDGSVWSCRKLGRAIGFGEWRKMLTRRGEGKHLYAMLYPGRQTVLVHRLVLEAFVGPCPVGMEACHFPDRNPANNGLQNLRWDTRKANQSDSAIHGTRMRGETHPKTKLSNGDVFEIRKLAKSAVPQKEIANRFRISVSTANRIVMGKCWRHLIASEVA